MHTPGTKKTAVHVEEEGGGKGGKTKKKNWKKLKKIQSRFPVANHRNLNSFFSTIDHSLRRAFGTHSDDGV